MLPPAMQAVQDSPVLRIFYAVEIALPGQTLRLLDGSGAVTWTDATNAVRTFLGADGDFGSILACEAITEEAATEPPKFALTLGPLTDAALQQIAQPSNQGSRVTIYHGFLDPVFLQPIATPETVWAGLLDIGNIVLDRNKRTIAVDIYCAAELMLLTDDGSKLCSAWHAQFYPSELGFQFVDSVTHPVPWGAKGPRPDQAINGSNYATLQNSGGGTPTLKF